MNILINASNLKKGGALQVTNSICKELSKYGQHNFIVVLSSSLNKLKNELNIYNNIKVFSYDVKNNFSTIVLGRDKYLDGLVSQEQIDVVLTVFGPSRWNPRCKHVCGFAMPHLVIPESPFYQRMNFFERMKYMLRNKLLLYFFRRSTSLFYTENPFITNRLQQKLPSSKVYTVTNFYNQIYDMQSKWEPVNLPVFEGITLLTISSYYMHKNLEISLDIVKVLNVKYPQIKVRFVFTLDKGEFPPIPEEYQSNFVFLGKVDVSQCPSLYSQSDMMFQPSLLECFTATYPEAMKMQKPIITTDLEFARGLCGDAAIYYSPLSPEDAADKIIKVALDVNIKKQLVRAGTYQLTKYDNYVDRVKKLIEILEIA